MNTVSALESMGLHAILNESGGLALTGLQTLAADRRQAVLAWARENKAAILNELQSLSPTAGRRIFPEPGKPHPWPTLWHLIERRNCNPLLLDAWPGAVVLCFAPGVLHSEKQAALAYAVENWLDLLRDMALPDDGSIRHCCIEGYEYYCRPGNVAEVNA